MIGRWARGYLPRERALINRVADEMKRQIANYIRGKVIEIFICGGVTYIAFAALGLNYAALLAMLVGISVVVPYVGAVVVTVPVALIGLFQWGWGDQFIYLMIAHGIIQALDGNVLVPLLFSEAVNLHPVAIICAVLLFGGLWGFWGSSLRFRWPRCSRPSSMPGRVMNPLWHHCFKQQVWIVAAPCVPQRLSEYQPLFRASACASTSATWPGTLTPRHS